MSFSPNLSGYALLAVCEAGQVIWSAFLQFFYDLLSLVADCHNGCTSKPKMLGVLERYQRITHHHSVVDQDPEQGQSWQIKPGAQ